ncbi:LysR family transcriptional regulator [Paraburkholderia heleia]|uniref:LysR family transcriptional regulator n=1 Tax=Paraburkholderia heleia TaxID=634127 RepID=UPI0009FC8CCD|nr:LysR family transcriptional regulator [Paraburkholderia heleia]
MDHLQSMRAFAAVAKLQSFTKAADLLNVSRPVLSRAISELEAHVGTRLLNRTTRTVSLAEDAREYFDICVQIIELLDTAERRLTDETISECGPIRVIVHPLAVASGISTVLNAFSATSACVKLHVTMQDAPLNLIESGYDVSLYPPELILNTTVVNRALFTSRYVLVASEQYLRRSGSLQSLCDISKHRIVDGRESNPNHRDSLELHDDACSISVGNAHFVVSGLVARELALAGTGLAILPELAVSADLARGSLVRVGSADALNLGEISLGLQYQRSTSLPRRVRTFIDACLSYFRAVGASHDMDGHAGESAAAPNPAAHHAIG